MTVLTENSSPVNASDQAQDLPESVSDQPQNEQLFENEDIEPKAVESWTDPEIVAYYDAHMAGKAVENLSARELQIAVRFGNIARQNREQAEETGFQAEVEAVRRQVSIQVNRYATAALLEEYHKRAFAELIRGGEVEEVRMVIRYKNREIAIGATDVAEAFGGFTSPKMREFTKAINDTLALAKATATQHRNRIERQKGRNWAKFTSDIRWSATVNEMRDADNGGL